MNRYLTLCFALTVLAPLGVLEAQETQPEEAISPGKPSGQSLVFIHPDGGGLAGWNIHRILEHGPDGDTHWDLLPRVAIYRSHMRNNLNASSHGGGTIHAYGVRVLKDSYGMNGKEPLLSASGYHGSVMMEARDAGIRVGIVNSGHLAEPGTGCFLASVETRADKLGVAAQLIESGADLIFGGGETLFLPKGVEGIHGKPGVREDGKNLIEAAERAGYRVIYHPRDLETLSSDDGKVLGLFAADNTYNDQSEEDLKAAGLPFYDPDTPTIGEMTEAALKWLRSSPEPFFLMVEEEGTDNFSNKMNASGAMEAFLRADAAIGVARKHVASHPNLTLLVAADSEASSPALISQGLEQAYPREGLELKPLPESTNEGAPLDGIEGTGTAPFVSPPDAFGQRHVFGIAWIDQGDHYGSVLARAEGAMADELPLNLDNTDVYQFLRAVLFRK